MVLFLQKKMDKINAPSKSAEKRSPSSSQHLSRAGIEREIIEFEQLSRQMLGRMDIMLMTINGIINEKDPTKRLEVKHIFVAVLLIWGFSTFYFIYCQKNGNL